MIKMSICQNQLFFKHLFSSSYEMQQLAAKASRENKKALLSKRENVH